MNNHQLEILETKYQLQTLYRLESNRKQKGLLIQ